MSESEAPAVWRRHHLLGGLRDTVELPGELETELGVPLG